MFVNTDFDAIIKRAFARDQNLFGTEDNTREIYEQRYIPGQKLYLFEQRPLEKAHVVFANDDIQNPELSLQRPASQRLEDIAADNGDSSA